MNLFKVGKTYKTHDGSSVRLVDDDGEMLTGIMTTFSGRASAHRWKYNGVFVNDFGTELYSLSLMPPQPIEVTLYLNIYKIPRIKTLCDYDVVPYNLLCHALKFKDNDKYVGTFPFFFRVPVE